MNAELVITIIEAILAPRSLNLVQSEIIRGAILGKSYQAIIATMEADDATRTERYQMSYIKETGATLWQSLSLRLGCRVTKTNLGAVMRWCAQQPEFSSLSGSARSPVKIDWGDSWHRQSRDGDSESCFYGRTEELVTLNNWCVLDRCRLISLLGMGGMGKTTLTRELVNGIKADFDFVIWRSLLNTPQVTDTIKEWLQFLSPQERNLPSSLERQIELLMAQLARNRCLLVLDNAESILAGRVNAGEYLPGYAGYSQLFQAIGELPHQSCLILTSREKPQTIARAEVVQPTLVRSLVVGGLGLNVAHELVQACGCPQLPAQMWQEVHAHYSGNPLALKIAALAAVEMTGGGEAILGLYPMMIEGKLQFQTIDDILARQFDRLSPAERALVYWLAIEREPTTGAELRSNLIPDLTIQGELINALESLLRRCIAFRNGQNWSLEPVTIAYVTGRAIDGIVSELSTNPPSPKFPSIEYEFLQLNSYAIIKAKTKDYLRRAQTQLILQPILDRLLTEWETPKALSHHLRGILATWQSHPATPIGYLAGNILNLLIELAPDRSLKDLDCSTLPIWSAYLVDVNLRHVNFTACEFDRTVFTQAFGRIVSVVFNPTGDIFATGDGNGEIHLWRLCDYQRVAIYRGHTNLVRGLFFTPDGKILASSSDDLRICLWEIATGRQLLSLGSDTESYRAVNFSPDGQRIVISGDDLGVRIYNLADLLANGANSPIKADCLQELVGHTSIIFSTVYSPNGRQLASTSADGTVRIWDLATGECIHILAHAHWTIRAFFSPDGSQLFVSGMSSTIYVWDTIKGELLRTLEGHTDWIWSIDLSPDLTTLVSAGEDMTIRVWDVATGTCKSIFRAHQQRIWAVAITPDCTQIISGSDDQTIEIRDLQRGKCWKRIDGYGNWIRSIAIVPRANWLVSGHRDGTIRLWDLENLLCIHKLLEHTDAVLSVAISPDGRYLASSSLDLTVRIWDLQQRSCLHTLDILIEGSWSLAFTPDGTKIVAACLNGQLQIWDVITGTLHRTMIAATPRIQSIAICPVSHLIATAWEDTVQLWDPITGECRHTFSTRQRTHSIVFSPDGRYLANGSMDKTVKIWDTTNWNCLQTLSGHQGWIMSVAFDPHRLDQILTSSCDRTIKRWNISTGECLQTYTGHTNWVWSVGYLPDGDSIVSASEDGTINIWSRDLNLPPNTIQLKRPYEEINITNSTGLLLGQRQTLEILGAVED